MLAIAVPFQLQFVAHGFAAVFTTVTVNHFEHRNDKVLEWTCFLVRKLHV